MFFFHGYDNRNGVMLTKIEPIILGSVNVNCRDGEGGVESFVNVAIVDVKGIDHDNDKNVKENIMFDDNVDDRDKANYFDNNMDVDMGESIIGGIDA